MSGVVFDARVHGVPCQVHVLTYEKAVPATYDDPPEPELFEFELLDRRGRRAAWLDRYLNDEVAMDFLCKFIEAKSEYFTEPEHGE